MGMRRLYQSSEQEVRGTMRVHNAADHVISVRLFGHNGPLKPVVMKPGDELELDAGYRRNLRAISPHLKEGSAPREPVAVDAQESFPAAPEPAPAPMAEPEPEPAAELPKTRKRGRPRKSEG